MAEEPNSNGELAEEQSAPDKMKHECGVLGIYAPGRNVARLAFFGLFALQHRGQEAAGLAVSDGRVVRMTKDKGLVSQVFNQERLDALPGYIAVGHTRYSTTGGDTQENVQPISCTSVLGSMAVAHNGNLVNSITLRDEMIAEGHRFVSTSDSEALALLFAQYYEHGPVEAARRTMERIQGAYSVVVATADSIVAFRDPLGLRPLILGEFEGGTVLASESCALHLIGAKFVRDVEPGEVIVVDADGVRSSQAMPSPRRAFCLFELIYFARPDSVMDGRSVYSARERMGELLAEKDVVDADIVCPVPDSGLPAAIGYARKSGLPFREGLLKNRYVQRTFIQPDPQDRMEMVNMKLSPLHEVIRDQRIVLVDDSIVRSTTMSKIVTMLRENGAKEIHVRITAPPIKWPCFYGVDMPSREQLAAAKHTEAEICEMIGADSLSYLSLEATIEAASGPKLSYCTACFTGTYPVPVPEEFDKLALEEKHDPGNLATVSLGSQLTLDV